MKAYAIACLFVAVACGDDGVRHLPDAPPDSSTDASADAATSGPVSLRLTYDDLPQAGINVYFQDASSTLVATVATGPDGVATATMDAGGFVTVVQPFPSKGGTHDVRTFAGVKPGDQLRIDENQGRVGLTLTLTLPFDANASMYDVYTSCSGKHTLSGSGGSGSIPSGLMFLYGCSGFADVLVQTTDFNGMPLGWFYHPNLAVSEGADLTLTDAYNLETAMPTNVTLTFSNVPAPFTSLLFTNVTGSMRGPILGLNYATTVTAGSAAQLVSRPPITNALSVMAIQPTPTNTFGSQTVVEWGPASVVAFDLSGALLPLYTAAPTYAPATRAVTWTAGTGAAPDLVVAEVFAARANDSWRWRMVAPYATAVVYPTLPAAIGMYNIEAGDTSEVQELTTAKVPGGYDAVRARLHSLRSPQDLEGLVTGATGRLVYEMLESQQPL